MAEPSGGALALAVTVDGAALDTANAPQETTVELKVTLDARFSDVIAAALASAAAATGAPARATASIATRLRLALYSPRLARWLRPSDSPRSAGLATPRDSLRLRPAPDAAVRAPPPSGPTAATTVIGGGSAPAPEAATRPWAWADPRPARFVLHDLAPELEIESPEDYGFVPEGDRSDASIAAPELDEAWLDPDLPLAEQPLATPGCRLLVLRRPLTAAFQRCRTAVLSSRLPCSQEEAVVLAALLCQCALGDYESSKLKEIQSRLDEFLPAEYGGLRDIHRKVGGEYSNLFGLTAGEAQARFVRTCRSLKTFGVVFFHVREKPSRKSRATEVLLGVTTLSIIRLDFETKALLSTWPLAQLRRWGASASSFTIDIGTFGDPFYTVQTPQAAIISRIISNRVDTIASKRAPSGKPPIEILLDRSTAPSVASSGQPNEGLQEDSPAGPDSPLPLAPAINHRRWTSSSSASSSSSAPNSDSPLAAAPPPPEVVAARESLLATIRNGFAVTVSAASRVEERAAAVVAVDADTAGAPVPSANDGSKLAVAAHCVFHLSFVAAVIVRLVGDPHALDYDVLDSRTNLLLLNLPEMAAAVAGDLARRDDATEREAVADAFRSVCMAAANFLEAVVDVTATRGASKEPLLVAARDVAATASDLLFLAGALDAAEDTQTELADCAREVARHVAEVVVHSKKVAFALADQERQLLLAGWARVAAEAANVLVACVTAVTPAASAAPCLDQITDASLYLKDAIIQLQETAVPCDDPSLVASVVESARLIDTSIDQLVGLAKGGSNGSRITPLEESAEQVVLAAEALPAASKSSESVVASAKDLTLAATRFVAEVKGAAAAGGATAPDQDRLLAVAREVAQLTARVVAAARDSANNSLDRSKRDAMLEAAALIRNAAAGETCARHPDRALLLFTRSARSATVSIGQLSIATRMSATSNRNLLAQIDANKAVRRLATLAPSVAVACEAYLASPNSVRLQAHLLQAATSLLPPTDAAVANTRVASATCGDRTLQLHLQVLTDHVAADAARIARSLAAVEAACPGLRLESSLLAAQDLLTAAEVGLVEPPATAATIADSGGLSTPSPADFVRELAKVAPTLAKGDRRGAGAAASEAVACLKSIVGAALATTGKDAPGAESHAEALAASRETVRALVGFLAEAKRVSAAASSSQPPAANWTSLLEPIALALSRLQNSLPGHRDLLRASQQVDACITEVSSGAFVPPASSAATTIAGQLLLAQARLESAAAAYSMAAGALSFAVLGSPVDFAAAVQSLMDVFEKLRSAVGGVCRVVADEAASGRLLFAFKETCSASKAFLRVTAGLWRDPHNVTVKTAHADASGELDDAVNQLVELCVSSSPGHAECAAAAVAIKTSAARLDTIEDIPSLGVTYSESIARVTDVSASLKTTLNTTVLTAAEGRTGKMGVALAQAAEQATLVVEGLCSAAYLVGVRHPQSIPAKPAVIDQAALSESSQAIRNACRDIVDPACSQARVLELAAVLARHTSRVCAACKAAGVDRSLNLADRQAFVAGAKDVASKTAAVVTCIKQMAVSPAEGGRVSAASACPILVDAVDSLATFSASPRFSSVPARMATEATALQRPLVEAGMALLGGLQNVVAAGRLVCSDPVNVSNIELLATESKRVLELIDKLGVVASCCAPGQKECDTALSSVLRMVAEIDRARNEAYAGHLDSESGTRSTTFVDAVRTLGGLVDAIARAITLEDNQVGGLVSEIPVAVEKVVVLGCSIAASEVDVASQLHFLDAMHALGTALQGLLVGIKRVAAQMIDASGESNIEEERAAARAAMLECLRFAENGVEAPPEYYRASEAIELRMSTLSDQIPSAPAHSFQALSDEVENLARQLTHDVARVALATDSTLSLPAIAERISGHFGAICDVACEAVAATSEEHVREFLLRALRELGGSSIRLVESLRSAGRQREASNAYGRLKSAKAARDVTERLVDLVSAAKEGTRAVRLCLDAAARVGVVVGDLDFAYLFAQTGTLDPTHSVEPFSRHSEAILVAAKNLVAAIESIALGVGQSQEAMGALVAATGTVDQLRTAVRSGAISLTSADRNSQQQLLASARRVAEHVQSVLQLSATDAARNHHSDAQAEELSEMSGAIKATLTAISELVRVTKLVGEETMRELRAVDAVIKSIDEAIAAQEVGRYRSSQEEDRPQVGHVARELSVSITAFASAACAPKAGLKNDLTVAANSIRKRSMDLMDSTGSLALVLGRETEAASSIESVTRRAMLATRQLAVRVRSTVEAAVVTDADRANIQTSAREATAATESVIVALDAFPLGGATESDAPHLSSVETALLEVAAAIDTEWATLATIPISGGGGEGTAIHGSDAVVEGIRAIAVASSTLIQAAASSERKARARSGAKRTETVLDAARSVGSGVAALCVAARAIGAATRPASSVVTGRRRGSHNADHASSVAAASESSVVAARGVRAAAMQLVASTLAAWPQPSGGDVIVETAAVEPPTAAVASAPVLVRAAGRGVAQAADQVVRAAERAASELRLLAEVERSLSPLGGPAGSPLSPTSPATATSAQPLSGLPTDTAGFSPRASVIFGAASPLPPPALLRLGGELESARARLAAARHGRY
ncbi:Talin-1 [Cladochytrium tenue]|nr:Talin-1 [Cladochytrium tenue]